MVPAETSELAPPMTPATATGFSASQMRSVLSGRVRSTSSSVVTVSPGVLARTMMVSPAMCARSNACKGWPISWST